MTLRAFSYGCGVQSTAALCLAAQGLIEYPLFLFANVGKDSENPATLEYLESVAKPYAAAHGIELVEVQKRRKTGELDTIVGTITRTRVSAPIPLYIGASGMGNRACTQGFKVTPINAELKRRGATASDPAALGVGISAEEWARMRTDKPGAISRLEYPLVKRNIDRPMCEQIIAEAGLPVPPKSSCFFCPLHGYGDWLKLKREQPELWRKAVALELLINTKRAAAGKDSASLVAHGRSLQAMDSSDQLEMFPDEATPCDIAGYCHV